MSDEDAEQRAEKRRRRIAGQRLSGLLMSDADELDDFRSKRLGRGTPIETTQLERLRQILERFGEALAEPSEEHWSQIEDIWTLLHENRPAAAEPTEPAPATQMSPATEDPAAGPPPSEDAPTSPRHATTEAPADDEGPPRVGAALDPAPTTLPRAGRASPWARPTEASQRSPAGSVIPVSTPLPLGAPLTRGYKPKTHAPGPPSRPTLPKAPPPPRPPSILDSETFAEELTTNTHVDVLPVLYDEDSEASVVTAVTMTADPATMRPAVLPFRNAGPRHEAMLAHVTATPGGMSLTGYAAFCAALGQPRADQAQVCARYGLDGPSSRQTLDRAWYARFDSDPRLHQLWGQLYSCFHALLGRAR